MKHLKIFETAALFESARATLDLPNVSLIEATMGVNYLPYVAPDPYNNHAYVEIAGVKWATMNIGASSVTDTGLYFQWADTQGYTSAQAGVSKNFGYDNGSYNIEEWEAYYKYWALDQDYYNNYGEIVGCPTKYNSTDNKVTLDSTDDAVSAAWGGNWRVPTKAEFESLIENTVQEWTDDYNGTGIAGMIFGTTEYDDNLGDDVFTPLLFFPAGGYYDTYNSFDDDHNWYWSNLRDTGDDGQQIYSLKFDDYNAEVNTNAMSCGCLLRGVCAVSNS